MDDARRRGGFERAVRHFAAGADVVGGPHDGLDVLPVAVLRGPGAVPAELGVADPGAAADERRFVLVFFYFDFSTFFRRVEKARRSLFLFFFFELKQNKT